MAATRHLLIGAAVLTAALSVVPVEAQTSRSGGEGRSAEERRGADEKPVKLFPNATRAEPKAETSSRLQRQLNSMIEALNDDDAQKALEIAQAIIGNERAKAYEKSLAYQVAGNSSADLDDLPAAIEFLKQALATNGLDNNSHYSVMQNVASFQMNNDQPAEAVTTLQQLIAETRTENPEIHVVLGSALFQTENFPAAIESLKKALSYTTEPKDEWLKLLQVAYVESEQPAEAAKIGEQLLARNPDDKRQMLALASSYLDLEQGEKAAVMLEQARAKGLFTETRDYQALYTLYFNIEGREKDVIAVIEEGLTKGILKRDLQTLNALAQAAYFSEDIPKAIASYKEAAALDPKGDTGLNLAKVLSAEAEDAQARDAAKAALAKGVAKPGEAWMVIARSESQLDNTAGTRAALQEAAKYPETRDQANRMLQQNR